MNSSPHINLMSRAGDDHQSEGNGAISSTIADQVVENLLGEALNDAELQGMRRLLESFAKVLTCDLSDAITGFAEEIANLHADFLANDRKKQLIDQLRMADDHFQKETSRIKKQHEKFTSDLAVWKANGGNKQANELHDKYRASRSKLESMDKLLKANGYKDEISEESFKELDKKVSALQDEMAQLERELAPFEGLEEVDEHSIRRLIQQKEQEVKKVEANLVNGSLSFL